MIMKYPSICRDVISMTVEKCKDGKPVVIVFGTGH